MLNLRQRSLTCTEDPFGILDLQNADSPYVETPSTTSSLRKILSRLWLSWYVGPKNASPNIEPFSLC